MAIEKTRFVWFDLMTTDPDAAAAFYKSVVGWDAADAGMTGTPYRIFSMGTSMVSGLMSVPPEQAAQGAQPMWMGHIGVEDVDAAVAAISAAGGSIERPVTEIPGIGRFAVAADMHGAHFIVFEPSQPMPAESSSLPGRMGWSELHGGDVATDFPFYAGLFGWTKADTIDMGPMGVYQLFETSGAGGGMMTKMPQMPAPMWLYYFNVDAADAVAERIRAAGGTVIVGPHEVPGGMWIVQGLDPQGAMFATVALTR